MFTNLNINPINYVESKEVFIGESSLSSIKKIDNKILLKTRKFSSKDGSELSPTNEEITLEQLNNEKIEIINYLEKLNILIKDIENIDNILK